MPNTREKLDVHSKLMGLIQRAPYIGCADTDRQYAVNWLMNEGVTVLTQDEAKNIYTVQEIENIQGEAYDLGVDSVLHHKFGLAWDDAAGLRKEIKRLQDAARWIPVTERLPNKEEYTAKSEDGTEYYVRLFIAYKTDIIEYEIGYYDGYKWMTEMPIRIIKDVVAWMPFPNLPQPPEGE